MTETGERPGAPKRPPAWIVRLAAGVEAAAPAAISVLVWFGIHSHLVREPWWSKFNVAAAPFFGDRVYYLGLGRATLVGAALLLLLYGALGIVFAMLGGGGRTGRALLRAALWLTSWHFFSQQYVWPRLDPAAAPYFPPSATAPAHAAAAILLARFPAVLHRLRELAVERDAVHELPPEPEAPVPPAAGSEGSGRQEDGGTPSPTEPDC
ncbi:MAG: hypothetical protein ACOYX1_05985 [Acidobacteriota bacterium]